VFGFARYDEAADTRQGIQHSKGRGVQNNRLLTSLAFGQEKQAALEIDVLPLQVKNFPKAATREEQERSAPAACGPMVVRRFSFGTCFEDDLLSNTG
jgi:hypothetical protein